MLRKGHELLFDPSYSVTIPRSVAVTKPDGTIENYGLFDDGLHDNWEMNDGKFGFEFTGTDQKGYYEFLFRRVGHTERGEVAMREESLGKIVSGIELGVITKSKPLHSGFQVGSTIPMGNFDKTTDSDVFFDIDTTYSLTNRFQLVAKLGYNHFADEIEEGLSHQRWINLSINLKTFINQPNTSGLDYYAQLGPGYYFQKSGSGSVGLNVSAGAQTNITKPIGLQFGIDYHQIFIKESIGFFGIRLGVIFL